MKYLWIIPQNLYFRPSHLASEMLDIIKYGKPGTIWAVVDGGPAFQYIFPTIESMKGNILLKQ